MLERKQQSNADLFLGIEVPQTYGDVISLLENPDATIGAKWVACSFIISDQLMRNKYSSVAAQAAKLEQVLFEAIIEQGSSDLLFKDFIRQRNGKKELETPPKPVIKPPEDQTEPIHVTKDVSITVLPKIEFIKRDPISEVKETINAQQLWDEVITKAETHTRTLPEYMQIIAKAGESVRSLRRPGKLKKTTSEMNNDPSITEVFMDEKVAFIPKIDAEIISVGDLHGGFDMFKRILLDQHIIQRLAAGTKPAPILVLQGDIMHGGQGDKSVELLEAVATLITKFPQNILFIRGNHETFETTSNSDPEISSRFNIQDKSRLVQIAEEWNTKLFEELPQMVACGNQAAIVHAQLPIFGKTLRYSDGLNQKERQKNDFEMRWGDLRYRFLEDGEDMPPDLVSIRKYCLDTIEELDKWDKKGDITITRSSLIRYSSVQSLFKKEGLKKNKYGDEQKTYEYSLIIPANRVEFCKDLLKGLYDEPNSLSYRDGLDIRYAVFIIDFLNRYLNDKWVSRRRNLDTNFMESAGLSVLIRGHEGAFEYISDNSITMNLQEVNPEDDNRGSIIVMPANAPVTIDGMKNGSLIHKLKPLSKLKLD